MEAATFVDLFSNVGFPTAMCAVLFWIPLCSLLLLWVTEASWRF